VRKGVADPITVKKMTAGNHTVELVFEATGNKYLGMKQTATVTIKADPVIVITATNISALYTANAIYNVVVTVDGVKVADNETVVINFNGIKYNVKTVNGTAKFPVNTAITIGKYTITAEYQNKTVSNTVDILNIINANKLKKLKKSKKVNKVKITLLKVDGKYLSKKTVVLKLKNKKVASAKTNSKGVATLKVKKKALKKFKKGKKVVATVIYGADTVTKKIKIA